MLPLPVDPTGYPQPQGLLLAAPAQRAVALSQSFLPIIDPLPCPVDFACPLAGAMIYPIFALRSNVQLQFFDLDANGNATLGKHVVIDGQLVGSRLIGNVMVLVTTFAPRVPYEQLPAGTPAAAEGHRAGADDLGRLPADLAGRQLRPPKRWSPTPTATSTRRTPRSPSR